MARWGGISQPRKKETKPRKARAPETKKRKEYVSKLIPIAKRGDVKGLAAQRKTASKVLLAKRLQDLSFKQLKAYAARAKVCVKTAQRDRGRKLHKNCITTEERDAVKLLWKALVVTHRTKEFERTCHLLCNADQLMAHAKDFNVHIATKDQAHRIIRETGIKRPRCVPERRYNPNWVRPANDNRV